MRVLWVAIVIVLAACLPGRPGGETPTAPVRPFQVDCEGMLPAPGEEVTIEHVQIAALDPDCHSYVTQLEGYWREPWEPPWVREPGKLGVGTPHLHRLDTDYDALAQHGFARTMTWTAHLDAAPAIHRAGLKYYPMVWGCRGGGLRQAATKRTFAQMYPGSTWLVFNEPDLPTQANCSVADGVSTYRRVEETVLGNDPTARLFCCGEGFARTGWTVAWYNEYVRTYGEPPTLHGIHMHLYTPRFHENLDGEYILQLWNEYRVKHAQHEWMRDLPIIISETGALGHVQAETLTAGQEMVVEQVVKVVMPEIMAPITALIEEDIVEAVLWFSTYYDEARYSNACTSARCDRLTPVGEELLRGREQ